NRSCSAYDEAFDSEPVKFQSFRIPYMSSRAVAHEGLRWRNVVDSLQMQLNSKASSEIATRGSRRSSRKPWAVVVCRSRINLVFVGAEVAPWSKTGGLGDVLGGLPQAMAANGHRDMTVAPRCDEYKDGWDTGIMFELKVGGSIETVRLFHCYQKGVDRVFVDHPMFLEKSTDIVWGKTGGKIHGPLAGTTTDYEDNQLRFSLLCQAALQAPRVLHLNNRDDVVFVVNDCHTALLPCYLKAMYQSHGIYKNVKVCDKPVKGRKINWMKAGLPESDRVVTGSPYYAQRA
ncbi:unnamed protein product, partial [Musa textilis]